MTIGFSSIKRKQTVIDGSFTYGLLQRFPAPHMPLTGFKNRSPCRSYVYPHMEEKEKKCLFNLQKAYAKNSQYVPDRFPQ